MVMGVVFTAIAVVVLDVLDNSIRSEEYLEETYENMPLLAVIPDAENPKAYGYYKGYYRGYYMSQEKQQTPNKTGGEQ